MRRFAVLFLAALLAACSAGNAPAPARPPASVPTVRAAAAAAASTPVPSAIATPVATTTPANTPVAGAPAAPRPAAVPASTCPPGATPTQAGLGDPLFPGLGNGGYDVAHYSLDLSVDMAAQRIAGTATLNARALAALGAFNLDFAGPDISAVEVDGRPAGFSRSGSELTVTPPVALVANRPFTVAVTYAGRPQPHTEPGDPIPTGWIFEGDGAYVASEPAGAHTWYPVNDHPCDKATYTLRITVPQPYTVAANGLLQSRTAGPGTTTYLYEPRDPIASYLVTIDVGRFITETQTGPGGLPIRNFYPQEVAPVAEAGLRDAPAMIEYYSSIFGPYPFETYGVVVANGGGTWALETQTLSLFGKEFARDPGQMRQVAAHELAHQWFGDSVSLASWQDLWLNEGFATYAADLWKEHAEGPNALRQDMVSAYHAMAEHAAPPPGRPSRDDLFNSSVYFRGALTLHALRLRIGDEKFFDLLRAYSARYRNGNASTADFVALAQEIAGQDLRQFLQDWLYGAQLPAIPEMGLFPGQVAGLNGTAPVPAP